MATVNPYVTFPGNCEEAFNTSWMISFREEEK